MKQYKKIKVECGHPWKARGFKRNKMIFKALALSGWRPKFSKKLRKKKVVFIDVTFDDFCDEA